MGLDYGGSQDETTPFVQVDTRDGVERLKRMEQTSWNSLMRFYAYELRNEINVSLRKRGLPSEWVDDIEQEMWMTAVKQIKDFQWQERGKLYNWLRSISTKHVQTLRRKVKENVTSIDENEYQVEEELSIDFLLYINGAVEDSAETQVLLRENMRIIESALQYLKPREREIMIRRLLLRETPQQMAEDYGVKPETISVILHRAKATLRSHIAAMGYFDTGDD